MKQFIETALTTIMMVFHSDTSFFGESAMLPLFQLCIFMQEEGVIFFGIFFCAVGGENILLNIFYAGGGENIHLKFAQWDVTGYLARPWHGQGQT